VTVNCKPGLQPRHHEVILTDHAWARWQERSGIKIKRSKLIALLQAKLNNALALGLELDHTGAGWLEITPVLWATVRLGTDGWVVTTFTRWDEREVG